MPAVSRASSLVRLAIGFSVLVVVAIIWIPLLFLFLPWRVARIKLSNYCGKVLGYTITRLSGATPVIRNRAGLEGGFPAIYVANHTSTLDAFLSIWVCPVGGCGVMKKEVLRAPVFGALYLLSGHLWIDRGETGKAIAALAKIARLVRARRLGMWIMPEGTRSKNGRLLPFKRGFVHLAIATGLPVVPVVFHGAHEVWAKGTLSFVPGVVTIDVLAPIPTGDWRAETAQAHADGVHDVMAAALPEGQRPLAPEA